MARRHGQASGASESKTSQSSTLAVTSPADSDGSQRLQDAQEILREIRERVLDEAIEAFELYGVVKDRVLEGDELVEALRRYDGVSLIQERVIELQDLEPSIDRFVAADPNDAEAKSLLDELAWLKCVLLLNGLSLLRCLRNTAFAMGLDPIPFTIVQENLTRETRAKALGVAELMVLKSRNVTSSIEPIAKPSDDQVDPSITMPMEEVMRAMYRFDGSRLLSAAAIAEELETRLHVETVRRAVVALEACGYVERPEGPRRGCRLTRAGRLKAGKIEA